MCANGTGHTSSIYIHWVSGENMKMKKILLMCFLQSNTDASPKPQAPQSIIYSKVAIVWLKKNTFSNFSQLKK
jgi:hypothetical protein